jgi:hypothetical protein
VSARTANQDQRDIRRSMRTDLRRGDESTTIPPFRLLIHGLILVAMTIRRPSILIFSVLAIVGWPISASAQLPRVGIIDFFGLRKITPAQVKEVLGIEVGDSLTSMALLEVPARLASLPGVASAGIHPVCCEEGKTMLYVGILEDSAPVIQFRTPPNGKSRLPTEVVQAAIAFSNAHRRAVMSGFMKEDITQGHSLMADSAARMIQLSFIPLAAKYADSLRKVLRTADDAAHRAFAAEVLAYSANKASVVNDLVYAMRDPSAEVRNDATRALSLIVVYGREHPDAKINVPYEPFIDLLNSLAWTDRNKASLALMQMTESRDPALLAILKARAFDAIVDVARWTNPGHAAAGVFILGRMAGIPDNDAYAMLERGEREKVIEAARK